MAPNVSGGVRGIRLLVPAFAALLLHGAAGAQTARAQTSMIVVLDGPPRPAAFFVVARAARPRVRHERLPADFREAFVHYDQGLARHRRLVRARQQAIEAEPDAREAIDARFDRRLRALDAEMDAALEAAVAAPVPESDGVARLFRALMLFDQATLRFADAIDRMDAAYQAGLEVPDPVMDVGATIVEARAAAALLHGREDALSARYEAWAHYLVAYAAMLADDFDAAIGAAQRGLAVGAPAKVHAELARTAADAHRERDEHAEAAAMLERAWQAAQETGYEPVLDITLYQLAFAQLERDPEAARRASLELLRRGGASPELREDLLQTVVPRLYAADARLPPAISLRERVHVRLAMTHVAANRGDVAAARAALDVAAIEAAGALDEDLAARVVMEQAAFDRRVAEPEAAVTWWLRERLVACGLGYAVLEIQRQGDRWRFVGGMTGDAEAQRCLGVTRRRGSGEVRRVDVHVRR